MITSQKQSRIDTAKILNDLLAKLSKRERGIIARRFGLSKEEKETLKKIGDTHKLTRERVRQIENSGIEKIKKIKEVNKDLDDFKKAIIGLLEEHGGIMEKDYLLKVLGHFYQSHDNENITRNQLNFFLSKLLNEDIEEIKNGAHHFQSSYKLKEQELDHLEEMAQELVSKIRELKEVYKTEDLFNLLTKLSSYEKHKAKFYIDQKIDISDIVNGYYPEQDHSIINQNKPLYSLLHSVKYLDQNKFGYWGLKEWSEIKPKRINDKIYLVLKHSGKPMHFTEIADKINNMGFDSKKANPATIHNELILDEKYVLVGRGIYGLREWGYKEGVVLDVIKDILLSEGKPLDKEEIVEKVLESRIVKRTTINLALMNQDVFEKVGDDKYWLK
jgi:hypothetical protein